MQNKNKKNKPYQFELQTVKLSECSPDDIRVKMAKKVLANSQRVLQEPDYHMGKHNEKHGRRPDADNQEGQAGR